MIKFFALSCIAFFLVIGCKAQYYYKDILNASEATDLISAYKTNKVKTITLKNIEYNGEENEDFYCVKKINNKYTSTELLTKSRTLGSSLMTTSYNTSGQIIKTYDSSDISVATTQYNYNPDQRISSIQSTLVSQDEDFTTIVKEDHFYNYDDKGKPAEMIKVLNGTDTTKYLFALDEAGNVAVEKNTRTAAKYYYYYDKEGRLTDIVLASDLRPGLHPEYIFTYNNAGNLVQMITTGATDGYNTWKYNYNDGLRIAEKLYNKERKLVGTMEYTYK